MLKLHQKQFQGNNKCYQQILVTVMLIKILLQCLINTQGKYSSVGKN